MSKKFNYELFNSIPVVGIMRNFPEAQLEPVVAAYIAAGLNTLEITMNSANPAQTIRSLKQAWGESLNVGAGTVCTIKDLEVALEAGAQFIVTPIVSKTVIKACVKEAIPIFPGAMTPTEIHKAWHWGATMIKIFPAGKLGPGYIKDVLEPLNEIKLLPTGGVSPDNFIEFLKMGASGVGMASALFPKDMIAEQRWDDLGRFYTGFVQQYHQYKNEQHV